MNSRKSIELLVLFLLSMIAGCEDQGLNTIIYPRDTSGQLTISQGVWGNVWFWVGNFQPVEPTGSITPVERQVFIHEATPFDSVYVVGGGFWRDIRTRLVATTGSNRTGFFQLFLPAGRYSAFVKEDSLYWSGYDNAIGIGGFEVTTDSVTKIQIDITYRAGF